MKIISNFVDYYDEVSGNKKSPIYNRINETIEDGSSLLKPVLTRAMIETESMHLNGDIWMTGYLSNKSSIDYVKIVPVLVGIAGEYHYYIQYYNSVLNIKRNFYNYEDLMPYYKNGQIKRTFELYYNGLLRKYCKQQFGCVNFILIKDDKLKFIKEPCLNDYPDIHRFLLTSQEIYSKIESFLVKTKELDKEYKKAKLNTPYEVTKKYKPFYKKKLLEKV